MEIHIEIMSAEHIPLVAAIERECFALPWNEESLGLFLGEGGFCMVAVDEQGRVQGYAGMLTVLDEGQIANVAVTASARRQGLGRSLICALEREAKERDICMLSLEVRGSNGAARSLYLSQGWEEVGVRKSFYSSPREDGIVMIKQI